MIEQALAEAGCHKTVEQMKNRYRSLRSTYTKGTDNNRRTGNDRKTTKFYGDIDEIFGSKDSVHPPYVKDTDDSNKDNEHIQSQETTTECEASLVIDLEQNEDSLANSKQVTNCPIFRCSS
jgi:hypothetical protein